MMKSTSAWLLSAMRVYDRWLPRLLQLIRYVCLDVKSGKASSEVGMGVQFSDDSSSMLDDSGGYLNWGFAENRNATTPRPDWLTVIAVAVVAHAAASVVHEGLGHGGACLLAGCRPQLLTTMQFQGDERTVSRAAIKFIAAGGTLANLAAATIAVGLLRRRRERANAGAFFLWLFATINLLQATGYLMYSGVSNIGDWAAVVRGLTPFWIWHGGLFLLGASTYWLATRWAMGQLGRRLRSSGAARVAEANRYTLSAYAVGGLLSLAAGLFEPGGALIVLIAGVAASLGGTSGLAWGPQLLHDPRVGEPAEPALRVTRDWRWIVAGAVVAAVFVFVLGHGVTLEAHRP